MAEGGEDEVELLLTPVSAMAISPGDLRRRSKRECASPTGQTPLGKARCGTARTQFSSRKRLSYSTNEAETGPNSSVSSCSIFGQVTEGAWSEEETKALLEFLLFHKGPGTTWFKRGCSDEFWLAAARFIRDRAKRLGLGLGLALDYCENS